MAVKSCHETEVLGSYVEPPSLATEKHMRRPVYITAVPKTKKQKHEKKTKKTYVRTLHTILVSIRLDMISWI